MALNVWWEALSWANAADFEQEELVLLASSLTEKAIAKPTLYE
jgi:hypothetical protein